MQKIDDVPERENLSGASQHAEHADEPHSIIERQAREERLRYNEMMYKLCSGPIFPPLEEKYKNKKSKKYGVYKFPAYRGCPIFTNSIILAWIIAIFRSLNYEARISFERSDRDDIVL